MGKKFMLPFLVIAALALAACAPELEQKSKEVPSYAETPSGRDSGGGGGDTTASTCRWDEHIWDSCMLGN